MALTEVRDHATGVKMFSEDRERGAVAGSVGGRLPDKYILVRNNELLHIRLVPPIYPFIQCLGSKIFLVPVSVSNDPIDFC